MERDQFERDEAKAVLDMEKEKMRIELEYLEATKKYELEEVRKNADHERSMRVIEQDAERD